MFNMEKRFRNKIIIIIIIIIIIYKEFIGKHHLASIVEKL